MDTDFPRPPTELIEHAGSAESCLRDEMLADAVPSELLEIWGATLVPGDPQETDARMGQAQCQTLVDLLPEGWSWEGKRVLDFGCGYGGILRHFVSAAPGAELWGCDIHRPSIDWLELNLSPPLNAFLNSEKPPLPKDDGFFDFVYSISVFTHLTEDWSSWLLELRRVLADDGLLMITFLNRGMNFLTELAVGHEGWDEDQIGMHVLGPGTPWNQGGPTVFLSEWWIRAHWGRAFEIVDMLVPTGSYGHSYALLRKKAAEVTREQLEAPEPGEPRELAAARHSLRHMLRECAVRRDELDLLRGQAHALEGKRAELSRDDAGLSAAVDTTRRELDQVRAELQAMRRSRSWRWTYPLRLVSDIRHRLSGSAEHSVGSLSR